MNYIRIMTGDRCRMTHHGQADAEIQNLTITCIIVSIYDNLYI